jgi:hypothetical protein
MKPTNWLIVLLLLVVSSATTFAQKGIRRTKSAPSNLQGRKNPNKESNYAKLPKKPESVYDKVEMPAKANQYDNASAPMGGATAKKLPRKRDNPNRNAVNLSAEAAAATNQPATIQRQPNALPQKMQPAPNPTPAVPSGKMPKRNRSNTN